MAAIRPPHVVVLAPMPLELQAIVHAFGLSASTDAADAPWTGQVGSADVTAVHIGMGPARARDALTRLLDESRNENETGGRIDHVMVAGICGGLDPDLEVGTLINPEFVVDHTSGKSYRHRPPGDGPQRGTIITTETATLDIEQSKRFFESGCLGVDMENSAVAEVCEASGHQWSVYRCIGDRWFDGLLDERIVAATNMDGSGDMEAIRRLLIEEPELVPKLDQLSRETTMAAARAAEAAVAGCLALFG